MDRTRTTELSETPSVVLDGVALGDEALASVRDTHAALVATGMDPFQAIEHTACGDRLVATHLWNRLEAANLWMGALRMVNIPTGTFKMGSPMKEKGRSDNEGPQREVTITRPFRMGAMPMTQGCWEALMGTNPSWFIGEPDLPVEQVSWNDICGSDGFLERLNALSKSVRPEGQVFRLPSEAEWEHACRAGTDTAYSFGDAPADFGAHGWFDGNADERTHPAGQKNPNPWGLYDMHGNVWEWCQDAWHSNGFKGAPDDGSAWMAGGYQSHRILRGGSFIGYAKDARSACRYKDDPYSQLHFIGFRLVLGEPFPKADG